MIAPLVLCLLSMTSLTAALALEGPVLTLWSAVSALSFGAALVLWLWTALRPLRASDRPPADPELRRWPDLPKQPADTRPRLLIDGSNVMYWENNEPRLDTLLAVIRALKVKDVRVGVIFDATAGHRLFGRYVDDAELARQIGLAPEDVLVVHKGTSADETLLRAARDMNARIVTNDRYRDHADKFPEVRDKGRFMRGSVEAGRVKWG